VEAAAELTTASAPAARAVVEDPIREVAAAAVEATEVPSVVTEESAPSAVSSVAGSKSFHDQVTGRVPLSVLCKVSPSTYHSLV